jgi:hypothetical protein
MPQLIPPPELVSLLVAFAPCFTRPSLQYFIDFVTTMIASPDRLTTTTVCRTAGLRTHWTNYSRFLSRYRWRVEDIAQRLLDLLLLHLPLARDDQGRRRLCCVLDETIVEKSSRRMFGVGWQINTHGGLCRGTHILGHYWLMLGALLRVGPRAFCFPLGFRLYRQKKRCPQDEYRKPWELACELLQSLNWPQAPDIVRTVLGDAGFAGKELLRWCAGHGFVAIVRGRIDAQVQDLYVPQAVPLRGRPRKYGPKICLRTFAADESNLKQTVYLYRDRIEARIASVVGLHRASGLPIRFVIVRCEGKDDVVLMSTDLSLTPREITMLYADRFAIEMTFRELKQHFGLGHYQVRVPRAILRHVHLSGIACSLTQLLTLRPIRDRLCHGILNWRPMPWRKRNTPISVRETQRLLRQACELEWTFALVPHTGGHINKSALAELSPLRSPKCAEL